MKLEFIVQIFSKYNKLKLNLEVNAKKILSEPIEPKSCLVQLFALNIYISKHI